MTRVLRTARQLGQTELKVLHSVFARGESTRASIARRTRLSSAKVSSILTLLEKDGYLRRAGKAMTKRGRPSHLFQIHSDMGYALGVAVGVDRFRVVAADGAKDIVFRREFPLVLSADAATQGQSIIDQISAEITRVIAKDLAGRRPIAVGLALPGLVDTQAGIWMLGLWLSGIAHVPVVSLLSERLGLPVSIEDIARCVAVYEMHCGHPPSVGNFVVIYLGSGVGAGIVLNREVYRGFHGMAGEVGHIEHPENAYRCICGNVGCLETVISAAGIQRVFKDRLAEGVISSLQRDGEGPDLDRILEAARGGDRFSQSTLREIGQFLGDACAILIKMFNPETLIISGEGAMFREFFAEPVEQVIRRRVLPGMLDEFSTTFAEYDPYHEAHGAALVAMDHHLDWRTQAPAAASRVVG